jgi:transglutaminase-like putative cysteine protease
VKTLPNLPRLVFPLAVFAGGLASAAEAGADPVVRGQDRFEFRYEVTLPKLDKPGRLWLPIGRSGRHQEVESFQVTSRSPWELVEDSDFGNTVLTMQVSPDDSGSTVTVTYRVTRTEKTAYAPDGAENVGRHLKAESLVPKDETLTEIARRVTKDLSNDTERGEALYRHVLAHMAYDKSGEGWGRGDALHACDSQAGNCTDFHAYFIGLARAIGIPARFAIGFTIPADSAEGEIGGYHCWAEFHADGKWIPVDISEADKHPALEDYYLGHHPANRFQLTLGRDLVVDPAPATGPLNYLIYPLLEVDGTSLPVERSFSFKRLELKK